MKLVGEKVESVIGVNNPTGPNNPGITDENSEIEILIIRRDVVNRTASDISEIDIAPRIDRHRIANWLL